MRGISWLAEELLTTEEGLCSKELYTVYTVYRPYIYIYICKVKGSRYRPGVAQRVGSGIVLLFHDRGTRRGWVVSNTPRPHFTPGKNPVPILQEAGWAPGWSGRAENLVPTGSRSRTVRPVVSRHTAWATRHTHTHTHAHNRPTCSTCFPNTLVGMLFHYLFISNQKEYIL